ncbi:hypothetical protein BGZ99_006598 [Dissophora globulifera]|uniref:N-acetyltransferase domain-containing protein n=1 Tax=Dissophora globulifera TaxID=979702 RepID=A0A9P6RS57_9FUNG|nr:hypothetical protein BGZ99_006598 [Dissophora globulifera]
MPSPSSLSQKQLRVSPISTQTRAGAAQVIFDTTMRSVPATFNFLKLRPMAFLLWTAISSVTLRVRKTSMSNLFEVLTICCGAVLVAQLVLFISLLIEASNLASGPATQQLMSFVNWEDLVAKDSSSDKPAADQSSGIRKRGAGGDNAAAATADTTTPTASGSDVKDKEKEEEVVVPVVKKTAENKDNRCWVLEKTTSTETRVVGCIGAVIDKSRSEAKLVGWAVEIDLQRNGCGTLLLKTAMDQLSGKAEVTKAVASGGPKTVQVKTVRVVLQGSQVAALRLFYKFGFKQLDRTPEWLGERVVLEIATKDWVKSQ